MIAYAPSRATNAGGLPPKEWDRNDRLFSLGIATGFFAERNHSGAAIAGEEIGLSFRDAAQGITIVGNPGEGKTSGVIGPLLYQALEHPVQAGVIALDIKGDFADTFLALAQRVNRPAIRVGIGPGCTSINLISNMSPSAAAHVVAQYMSRGATGDNAFFINSSTQIIEAALGLLKAQPDQYHLAAVRDVAMVDATRDEAIRIAKEALASAEFQNLSAAEIEDIDSIAFGISYFEKDFIFGLKADKETFGNVLSQLSTALIHFGYPSLARSLCDTSHGSLDFSALYDGAAMVVTFPSATHAAAAPLIFQLIGSQLQSLIRARATMRPRSEKQWRPIIMVCDEFQEATNATYVDFFALSRSQNFIPVVSFQNKESILRVMTKFDADLMVGNMGTRIGLLVGTKESYDMFRDVIGDAEYQELQKSRTSHATNPIAAMTGGTKTTSIQNKTRPVVDGQVFRALTADLENLVFQAVCVSRAGGRSQDDVISMQGIPI